MKKLLLFALATMIFYAPASQAEDREWAPYKKLVESTYLDKFYRTEPSQRDKLRLLIQFVPANKAISPGNVVLTVVHAGGKDKLPLNADGTMELEPNPEWIKEDAMVYTNLPKNEKSGVAAVFAAKTPQSLQMSYAEMMGSVPQWNALIKEHAGILRFMLPKFNAIHLHFAKPTQQTLQVLAKDGTKTYSADPKGELVLQLNDTLMKDNPQIVLSEKPDWIEMDEL